MKVIDKALAALQSLGGYSPEVQDGFLIVKDHGVFFRIADTSDIQLHAPLCKVDLIFPIAEEHKSIDMKPIANQVNMDFLIVKTILAGNNEAVAFTAETFVCETDSFEELLPSLFQALHSAAAAFFQQLQK